MKNLIRRYIDRSARHPGFYRRVWHPLARLTALAYREHYRLGLPNTSDVTAIMDRLCPEKTVAHGPFKGMVYPVAESAGSSIWPKLLGCYEQELRGVIEEMAATDYANVVDIGCAEGYYAIGMAMRCPNAKVWAFDTNTRAKELCLNMAKANGVDRRLELGGFCDEQTLVDVASTGRTLVISDCEGFEGNLFSEGVCKSLAKADLIIEIHDFLRPGLSRELFPRLSQTHRVERIRSVPDAVRPQVFPYEELRDIEDAAKIELMCELRPMPMEWFVCRQRV